MGAHGTVVAVASPMMHRRVSAWLLLVTSLARCGGADEAPAPARFTCARPDEAPLPDEAGGWRCLRVGAREGVRADVWPDVAGLPGPVLYVMATAPAGGDGSRERPLRTLAEAVARGFGAAALARGEHTLDAPLTLDGARTVAGADPGTTALRLAPGAGLVASGELSVRGLALRAPTAAPTERDLPLSAARGATLTLDDVVVEGGYDGVSAQDATLVARHLTVRRTARRGVSLVGAGWGIAASLLVRDGAGAGVVADGARLRVAEALVAAQGRPGFTLRGAGAVAGTADCGAADPRATAGPYDCLREVAVVDGRSAGLWARGARSVEVQRSLVARMRPTPDDESADGLYVGEGADVRVDPGVSSDAMQGRGSIFADNARLGVVVDGGGEGAPTRSRLTLHGAWVDANAGGGVFAQNAAVVPRVAYCRFVGNGGFGLAAVPSASVVSIACNGFIATRPATLAAVTAAGERVTLAVADGLSLARPGDVQVVENEFRENARFAAILVSAGGRLSANRGDNNRYGLGVYNSAALEVAASNRVTGREPAPAALPPVVTR